MARRKEFSLPGATKTGEGGSREFRKHVLKSIAEMAKQLGRSPSFAEFAARSGISKYTVMRDFSKWTQAVRAAGLKPEWVRNRLGADELLKDWGEAVRKKGGVPSTSSYVAHGKHACQTVAKRFGGWDALPAAFLKFAAGKSEWGDVVILLEQAMRQQNFSEAHQREGTRRRDSGIPRAVRGNLRGFSDALHPPIAGRTIYGDTVNFRGMRHEPVNGCSAPLRHVGRRDGLLGRVGANRLSRLRGQAPCGAGRMATRADRIRIREQEFPATPAPLARLRCNCLLAAQLEGMSKADRGD